MSVESAAVTITAVLSLAAVIRSALGFGEALVAVPLLALVVPVEVAAPVAVLVSITVALIAVAEDWRKIHFQSAVWLVLSTMAGIPLGLAILRSVPEAVVKLILAAVIIAFSTDALRRGQHGELKNDRFALAFGFLAGI